VNQLDGKGRGMERWRAVVREIVRAREKDDGRDGEWSTGSGETRGRRWTEGRDAGRQWPMGNSSPSPWGPVRPFGLGRRKFAGERPPLRGHHGSKHALQRRGAQGGCFPPLRQYSAASWRHLTTHEGLTTTTTDTIDVNVRRSFAVFFGDSGSDGASAGAMQA